MLYDKENKITKWQDIEVLELTQLSKYDCFDDFGKGSRLPNRYKLLAVHMVYDIKHDD